MPFKCQQYWSQWSIFSKTKGVKVWLVHKKSRKNRPPQQFIYYFSALYHFQQLVLALACVLWSMSCTEFWRIDMTRGIEVLLIIWLWFGKKVVAILLIVLWNTTWYNYGCTRVMPLPPIFVSDTFPILPPAIIFHNRRQRQNGTPRK